MAVILRILRELEVLKGSITDRLNLDNIRYVDDTELIGDSERELQ